jgi:aminopeptidase YwaD
MPAVVTDSDARYALEIVKAICTEVGPGLPGSPQERERAAMLAKELESHLGAKDVAMEEFTLAPGAFLGSLPISALLMLVAALLNFSVGRLTGMPAWGTALAALALSILSVLLVVLEYVRYVEIVDPFFKKKRSVNVTGTLRQPGTQETKRLLILSGHHDSAWDNTWMRFLGYGLFVTVPTVDSSLLAPEVGHSRRADH